MAPDIAIAGAIVSNRLLSISYKHAHGASSTDGSGDDMERIGCIGAVPEVAILVIGRWRSPLSGGSEFLRRGV